MFNDLNWKCCARLAALFPLQLALYTGHICFFFGRFWVPENSLSAHVILNEKSVSELGKV